MKGKYSLKNRGMRKMKKGDWFMKKYRNNTLTRSNLESAIANEAVCHVKYTLWGNEAEKEGYPEIADCYRTAAKNEISHAEVCMRELGMIGSINENLQSAVEHENRMGTEYTNFASDAENEGYEQVKEKFLNIAQAEQQHFDTFSTLYHRLISDEMFVSPDCDTHWRCYNCGFVEEGESPPERCPLCERPETWFARQQ